MNHSDHFTKALPYAELQTHCKTMMHLLTMFISTIQAMHRLLWIQLKDPAMSQQLRFDPYLINV